MMDSFDDNSLTRVKEEYMNEPRSHLDESDPKDRMTKKNLKEWKVTTYTGKVHLLVKRVLLGRILC